MTKLQNKQYCCSFYEIHNFFGTKTLSFLINLILHSLVQNISAHKHHIVARRILLYCPKKSVPFSYRLSFKKSSELKRQPTITIEEGIKDLLSHYEGLK